MANFIADGYEPSEKIDNLSEKLIIVKRNSKVTKGGRVFGFSAITVVGDKNGRVGIGRGKAKEVPFAIQKAMDDARKNIIFIKLNKGTIYHKISTKYCATKLVMLPASEGTGIISSYAMRAIFEVAGIKNIFAKCFGSKNPDNLVKCAIKGLMEIEKNVESNFNRKSELKKIKLQDLK